MAAPYHNDTLDPYISERSDKPLAGRHLPAGLHINARHPLRASYTLVIFTTHTGNSCADRASADHAHKGTERAKDRKCNAGG